MTASTPSKTVIIDGVMGRLVHVHSGATVTVSPPSVVVPIWYDKANDSFSLPKDMKENLSVGLNSFVCWVCSFPFRVEFRGKGPAKNDPSTSFPSHPFGKSDLYVAEAYVKDHAHGDRLIYDIFVKIPGELGERVVDPSIIIDTVLNQFEVR